jgi:hypothetical protein
VTTLVTKVTELRTYQDGVMARLSGDNAQNTYVVFPVATAPRVGDMFRVTITKEVTHEGKASSDYR